MNVIYSCVVDCKYKFQYQGWLWVNSLILNANVQPQNIWVHCINGVDEDFKKLCAELGVNVIEIDPIGDKKYCNKLAQLSNPSLRNANILILMDTDTFIIENFEKYLNANSICAKPVDTAIPGISSFDELFKIAGLRKSTSINDTKASTMDVQTYGANFNGGLYCIPTKYIDALSTSWLKWANWLLSHVKQENRVEFPDIHIDQMSFCMAVHENDFSITELDILFNFPLHLLNRAEREPYMLHYHWKIDPVGQIEDVSDVILDNAIKKANITIKKTYNNIIFCNYRYELRPELKEFIGKVKMNYSYYHGQDVYSDGVIENELLNIAMEARDVNQVLANDNRWPVLYHYSPIRENIINWYNFRKDASILEVGAGCGGVTGALLKGGNVVAVDMSKKRSLINAYRHKGYDNLEIIVGNFNDIVFDRKFDYITLIGVLEYASHYTLTAQNPYIEFLKKIRQNIKNDGKLIVAIENKFGLKYWAGAKEDHTGCVFEGIEGYKNSKNIRTFSKLELKRNLKQAGYTELEFFYPYPDYKFPLAVYSNRRLPKYEELIISDHNYDNESIRLFNEQNVYGELLADGMFDYFSNSFLVFAANSGGDVWA